MEKKNKFSIKKKRKISENKLWDAMKIEKCRFPKDELPNNTLVVDASVKKKNNNPLGLGEIKAIDLLTGEIVFNEVLDGEITQNMAEYIAIYKASEWCLTNDVKRVIFSDSLNAIIWSKEGKSNPSIYSNSTNIRRLQLKADSHFRVGGKKIYFWNKKLWGENPADFGRKNKR